MYRPANTHLITLEELTAFVRDELNRIAESFSEFDFIKLTVQRTAPLKVFEGLVVLADGTNWNPGQGAGVYAYYNGSWKKLG